MNLEVVPPLNISYHYPQPFTKKSSVIKLRHCQRAVDEACSPHRVDKHSLIVNSIPKLVHYNGSFTSSISIICKDLIPKKLHSAVLAISNETPINLAATPSKSCRVLKYSHHYYQVFDKNLQLSRLAIASALLTKLTTTPPIICC